MRQLLGGRRLLRLGRGTVALLVGESIHLLEDMLLHRLDVNGRIHRDLSAFLLKDELFHLRMDGFSVHLLRFDSLEVGRPVLQRRAREGGSVRVQHAFVGTDVDDIVAHQNPDAIVVLLVALADGLSERHGRNVLHFHLHLIGQAKSGCMGLEEVLMGHNRQVRLAGSQVSRLGLQRLGVRGELLGKLHPFLLGPAGLQELGRVRHGGYVRVELGGILLGVHLFGHSRAGHEQGAQQNCFVNHFN
mmetsp:Transcript_50111/g.108869  ORF Transcript_50111/g.108869 Transcript_50111/m.108869 type:complete len:245 (-) Transcript_50111:25-759(-)